MTPARTRSGCQTFTARSVLPFRVETVATNRGRAIFVSPLCATQGSVRHAPGSSTETIVRAPRVSVVVRGAPSTVSGAIASLSFNVDGRTTFRSSSTTT